MFEDVRKEDEKVVAGPTSKGRIEDMFAPVDPSPDAKSAIQGGRLTPVSGSAQGGQPPVPPADGLRIGPPDPLTHLSQIDNWSTKKSRRGLLITVIVVVLLAGGGAAAYFLYSVPSVAPLTNTNAQVNQPLDNTNTTANTNTANTNEDVQPPTNAAIDSDLDGLTDVEEESLGTDPNLVDTDSDGLSDKDEAKVYKTNPLVSDTDNDGLSDRDEIFVWKTDPNNPDTDGDTFLDGAEVQNGYNPNGPGKLTPPAL